MTRLTSEARWTPDAFVGTYAFPTTILAISISNKKVELLLDTF